VSRLKARERREREDELPLRWNILPKRLMFIVEESKADAAIKAKIEKLSKSLEQVS
jgi:hypothetical protein